MEAPKGTKTSITRVFKHKKANLAANVDHDEDFAKNKETVSDEQDESSSASKEIRAKGSGDASGDEKAPLKPMGPSCSCRLSCGNRVTDATRRELHENFWNNCSTTQRKQYVALSITEAPKKRTRCRGGDDNNITRTKKRQSTWTYLLLARDELVRVCKTMFLNTFAITEKYVRVVMKKKRESKADNGSMDLRSRRTKKSKFVKDTVRRHIRSFEVEALPGDESGRGYLDSSLNVSAMHKLYVKHCREIGIRDEDVVRQAYYREIFKSEFNLGFKCKEVAT